MKTLLALFTILLMASSTQAMQSEPALALRHKKTYISNTLLNEYYFSRYGFSEIENKFEINIETNTRLSRGSLIYSKKYNSRNPICEISEITITQDCEKILPNLIEFLRMHLACSKFVIHFNLEQKALIEACIAIGFTVPDLNLEYENTLVYSPRHSSV